MHKLIHLNKKTVYGAQEFNQLRSGNCVQYRSYNTPLTNAPYNKRGCFYYPNPINYSQESKCLQQRSSQSEQNSF